MAGRRLSMRRSREILRLKWDLALSHREVARSLGLGVGTVSQTLHRARVAGLADWVMVQGLDEETLEQRLYPRVEVAGGERAPPDWRRIHTELRQPGVTLQLLHLARHPAGYRYSQFCEHYRRWVQRQRRSMRHVHRAGKKLFVDYAGPPPPPPSDTLTVTIEGPASVKPNVYCSWWADVSGGSGSYAYQWYQNSAPQGTGADVTLYTGTANFTIRLNVTDPATGAWGTDTLNVVVTASAPQCLY